MKASLALSILVMLSGCGVGRDVSSVSASGGTGSPSPAAVCASGSAPGAASLSWTAPSTNTNGTPVTNLAGYKLYYGTTSGVYTGVVDLQGAWQTSYTVTGLMPADYYFAMTVYDSYGTESGYSNEVCRSVN